MSQMAQKEFILGTLFHIWADNYLFNNIYYNNNHLGLGQV